MRQWACECIPVNPGSPNASSITHYASPFTRHDLLQLSIANIGIGAFTAGLAIGAERVDIESAMGARAQILIRALPRIVRHAIEVTAFLPIARLGRGGRFLGQGLQALISGRIIKVIQ